MMFCVSLMSITKDKPRVNTQKIKRKESKHCTVKSHQITEEDSKRETKEL